MPKKKSIPSVDTLVKGIRKGDRVLLGKAITLVESTRPDHRALAQQVIEQTLSLAGKSLRIGITGTPGVGKSTFIEALGMLLSSKGYRVAVLAIDPTSQLSKGSILGDKTRMEKLAADPNAFIRPSPTGGSLGGVARKSRETIMLCEAAGFDIILVETVGVGQSETTVHSMVDLFLLLLLPGAGDELQGIKRGIVEMADLIAVNKADGDRLDQAKRSGQAYRNALHLFPPKENRWTPRVTICSALEGNGIPEIWEEILRFKKHTRENGSFEANRTRQSGFWFLESIRSGLERWFFEHPEIHNRIEPLKEEVLQGKKSPFQAAEELLDRLND